MRKIGIIACANTTKVLDCPLSPCLRDFYDRKGKFSRYQDDEPELVGIVSYPGCLGGLAPAAILSKAHSLVFPWNVFPLTRKRGRSATAHQPHQADLYRFEAPLIRKFL